MPLRSETGQSPKNGWGGAYRTFFKLPAKAGLEDNDGAFSLATLGQKGCYPCIIGQEGFPVGVGG